VQITKDYYKPYLAATEPMFVKPREIKFYERMEGDWTLRQGTGYEQLLLHHSYLSDSYRTSLDHDKKQMWKCRDLQSGR
ncbi:MAG: hypothetical protein L6R42_009780, partial [Xanthoria sp. 1 TBL-2021]